MYTTILPSDRSQRAAATALRLVARVRATLLVLVFFLACVGSAGIALSSCSEPPPEPVTKTYTGWDSQGRSATGTVTANTDGTVTLTSTFNTGGVTTNEQVVGFLDSNGDLIGTDASYPGGSTTVTPPTGATTVVVGAQSSDGATFFTSVSVK